MMIQERHGANLGSNIGWTEYSVWEITSRKGAYVEVVLTILMVSLDLLFLLILPSDVIPTVVVPFSILIVFFMVADLSIHWRIRRTRPHALFKQVEYAPETVIPMIDRSLEAKGMDYVRMPSEEYKRKGRLKSVKKLMASQATYQVYEIGQDGSFIMLLIQGGDRGPSRLTWIIAGAPAIKEREDLKALTGIIDNAFVK